MKNIFLIFMIATFLVGCIDRKPKHTFISEKQYEEYLNIKADEWCTNCKEVEFKNQTFQFTMDIDFDFNSIEHEFIIIRKGAIYRGNFSNTINLTNVCYCLDNNLMKLNTIAFVLIDKENKKVYKWYEKQSYYLHKKDTLTVRLKDDGTYKVRFK